MPDSNSVENAECISIVMLVNEFPPLPVGGSEVQAERLTVQLVEQGLRVGVITRGFEGLPTHDEREGFWILRIAQHGFGKLKSLSFFVGAIFALYKLRNSFDILHAHLAFTPAIVAVIMGRLLGVPVIIKYGNSGPHGDIHAAQSTLRGRVKLALFRRWADVHIALDHNIEAELHGAGFPPDRVKFIVNGIDTSAFIPVEDKSSHKNSLGLGGKIVVIFVGRLAPQKSLPVLLEAFQETLSKIPNMHLLLVGEGPERQNLRQLVDNLSINHVVTFTGNVSDVRSYLSASDIFVLPSLSEGISNALLEAMASGLACVATRVGGTSYILDDGTCGVLIATGNPRLLAGKLAELAYNPELMARLGALARERILTRFDIAIVGKQYEELYTRLIANRKGLGAFHCG